MSKNYKNLIIAFEQFDWQPPKEIFRIYYDSEGTITCKTNQLLEGQHIEVSRELYEEVYMLAHWWVKDQKVQRRPVAQLTRSMLKYQDNGPYRTLPEMPIFLVNGSYSGPVTEWKF